MKKVLFLLLLPFMVAVTCSREKCSPVDKPYSQIDQMFAAIYEDSAHTRNSVVHHDTLRSWDYSISLTFETTPVAANKQNGLNLFPGAYALSCPSPGDKGTHENIESLVIYTKYPIGDTIIAGTDVTSLFEFDFTGPGNRSIPYYFDSYKRKLDGSTIPTFEKGIQLVFPPKIQFHLEDTASFTLVLTLDNGAKYSAVTEPVFLYW